MNTVASMTIILLPENLILILDKKPAIYGS